MEQIPLPEKYTINETGANQGNVVIEPFYPGYGTTIGNTLRRILLSSLSGAAITAVKIKGITHEFSSIPGIKEDMVEIILNLKQVRFKLHDTAETKFTLKVKGGCEVKAKDFKGTSEIEFVNPNLHIATITEKNAVLEMEVTANSGRGYVPVESVEDNKMALGTIAIDAVYTPIKNVNFTTENVRVGKMTNYDRLNLEITTDGTMTPEEALHTAVNILLEQYTKIADLGSKDTGKKTDSSDNKDKVAVKSIIKKSTAKDKEEKDDTAKTKRKRGRPKKE